MSRYKIQTQFFISGAIYLALILSTVTLSILIKDRLANMTNDTQRVFEQVIVLDSMKEDIDQAITDSLLVLDAHPDALVSLQSNLDEVLNEADRAKAALVSEDLPIPAVPEGWTVLAEVLAGVEEMRASLEGFSEQTQDAQQQFMRDQIFPLLSRYAREMDDIRDERRIFRGGINARKTDVLKNSQRNFILVGIVAVLATCLLAFLFGRGMSRPFLAIAESVTHLKAGNYEATISGQDRLDEVGDINRALDALQGQLQTAETHRQEEAAVNARRSDFFETLGVRMAEVSHGQLDASMSPSEWDDLGDDYVKLCDDFNKLGVNFASIVGSVRESAMAVEGNSRDLSAMSDDMSQRAEVQAATLEESAAALAELSAGVKAAAERAQEADSIVLEGRSKAEAGGAIMEQALAAMGSIAHASEQINDIIGVIDDIAFQTNLLALNAGVEAARAGPSGKGFSVVASEVRLLAQRASESAREIKSLVTESSRRVQDGGELVEKTSQTLTDIVSTVNDVAKMVSDVATAAREQSTGLEEINVGVSELDRVTQENVASVTQLSSASSGLNNEASRMTEMLTRFGSDTSIEGDAASAGGDIVSSADVAVEAMAVDLPNIDSDNGFAPAAPSVPSTETRPAATGTNPSVWQEF